MADDCWSVPELTQLQVIPASSLEEHLRDLSDCRRCSNMNPPVITGGPVDSRVILVGQAPGGREGEIGKPFAWTAGKTLFKWFASIGLDETQLRTRIYISAVCRCFPGKNPKGGDRVPNQAEIDNCATWLDQEISMLQPQLVIAVGKLSINQFMPASRLQDVISKMFLAERAGCSFDLIPLPHPSGASTWHQSSPGRELLSKALQTIESHPAFRRIVVRARQNK